MWIVKMSSRALELWSSLYSLMVGVVLLGILAGIPQLALAQDTDGDRMVDLIDNCPNLVNSDQRDSDADDLGDLCDPQPFNEPIIGAVDGTSLEPIGPRSCHIFTLRIPPANGSYGDTLPPGREIYYQFAIFDTGATAIRINAADARLLKLGSAVPISSAFDMRIWGFQSVSLFLGAPLDFPEAEIELIKVRNPPEENIPNVLGAPVTNRVAAYIDYSIKVDREYSFGTIRCAAMSFFPSLSDTTDTIELLPQPLYFVDLEPFGSIEPGADGSSRGLRYYLPSLRFINGTNIAEAGTIAEYETAGTFRVLYDTGNTVTQVTQDVAEALGIDLSATPERTIEINTTLSPCKDPITNLRTAFGYRIGRFEIDASDGSHSYVVENPLVFVVPTDQCKDLQAPIPPDIVFGGAADVNLGTDFFQTTQVLFDGPGNRLGMFTGVPNDMGL